MKAVMLNNEVINIGNLDLGEELEDGSYSNPLPIGAEEGKFDILVKPNGCYYLSSNDQIRIELINSKASEIILNKYPLYKQNDITLLLMPYTEIDLEEMKMFIEIVRNIAKNAKENNVAFSDIDWAGLDK